MPEGEEEELTYYDNSSFKRVCHATYIDHRLNLPYTNTLEQDLERFDPDQHKAVAQRLQVSACYEL